MNLSKSKYTRFCQCPKMLWLDTYRPELAVQDPALQRRFQEGNEVGDLAMGLLGDFVETTAYTADGKLDIPAMLKNTKKYNSFRRFVEYLPVFDTPLRPFPTTVGFVRRRGGTAGCVGDGAQRVRQVVVAAGCAGGGVCGRGRESAGGGRKGLKR